MPSMQQAVLEFDEAVQVPWRPRLGSAPRAGVPARRRAHSGATVLRLPSAVAADSPAPARSAVVAQVPGSTSVGRVPAAPVSSEGPRPARRRRRADAPVRLTRRGRRLLVAVSLAVGVAVGAWVAPALAGTSGHLRLAGDSSVVVRSGDTLWSIASSVAGGDDVRVVVDRIRRLNHLSGATLEPGQVLQLP